MALPQQAITNRLLCDIPAYAHSPSNLATIARREYVKAGYGEPRRVHINPARVSEPVVIGGLRFVPDAKIKVGQMRVE